MPENRQITVINSPTSKLPESPVNESSTRILRHHRVLVTIDSGSRNNKLQPPGEGDAGHPVASRCSRNPLSRPACLLPNCELCRSLGKKDRRSKNDHETPCISLVRPCLWHWGATVSFWNTRESTFQNRYVHLPQRRVY